jgi:hypothetical protein
MKHQIQVIVCVGMINRISRKKIFANLSFDETELFKREDKCQTFTFIRSIRAAGERGMETLLGTYIPTFIKM